MRLKYAIFSISALKNDLVALLDKQNLYRLGGRKLGVTSLPPLGCLPAARTLFGFHESGCVSRINTDAQGFNKKINSAAASLQKQLPGLRIVVFDIFKPLYDVVAAPSKYGSEEKILIISSLI